MTKATTIELDIAKQFFQVHGADRSGRAVLRRKLRRNEVVRFFSEQPPLRGGDRGQRQRASLGARAQ
jgi:transposase